jgi:hypothetical protein
VTWLAQRQSPAPDPKSTRSLDDFAQAHISLQFDIPPELSESATLSMEVLSDVDAYDVRILVSKPEQFELSTADPSGYDELDDNIVVWDGVNLTEGVPSTFSISGASAEPFKGWIDVRVEDISDPDYPISYGSKSIAVQVTNGGAQVSDTGREFMPALDGSESDLKALYNTPVMAQLTWDPFPEPGTSATAYLTVTNTTTSSKTYNGAVLLPSGWTLTGGSSTWQETLSGSASSVHTFDVDADDDTGSWQTRFNLVPSSGSPWYLAQNGIFLDNENITSINEHQEWGRYTASWPFAQSNQAIALPVTTDIMTDEEGRGALEAASAVLPQPAAGPRQQQQANCNTAAVRIHGQASVTPGFGGAAPASYLTINMVVKRWTQNGMNMTYDGESIFTGRLTQAGNFEVCFNLDGRAEVT